MSLVFDDQLERNSMMTRLQLGHGLEDQIGSWLHELRTHLYITALAQVTARRGGMADVADADGQESGCVWGISCG